MRQTQCVVCGKAMTERRAGKKKYCSDVCRAFQWRTGQSATPCRYCGCPADTVDHVPPQSARPILVTHGLQPNYPFIEVDACRECNTLLGNRALWTVPKRKRFIRRALRLRYRRLLRLPAWSPEQLAELGHNMRSFVSAGLIAKAVLLDRLKW